MRKKRARALCPECGQIRVVTETGLIWSHGPCRGSRLDTHGWPVREETDHEVILHQPDRRGPGEVELTAEQQHVIVGWFRDLAPGPEDAAQAFAETRAELARINEELANAGIDYPTGARGVRDLAGLLKAATARADEAEAELKRLKGGL